jgi:hypothetical protein
MGGVDVEKAVQAVAPDADAASQPCRSMSSVRAPPRAAATAAAMPAMPPPITATSQVSTGPGPAAEIAMDAPPGIPHQ